MLLEGLAKFDRTLHFSVLKSIFSIIASHIACLSIFCCKCCASIKDFVAMYAMVSSANSCRVEKEELEDTIGVIKIRKSKNDR